MLYILYTTIVLHYKISPPLAARRRIRALLLGRRPDPIVYNEVEPYISETTNVHQIPIVFISYFSEKSELPYLILIVLKNIEEHVI